MKQFTALMTILFFSFMCIGLSGCDGGGGDQPPKKEKTPEELLQSPDPKEQSEGLDKAAEKFGGDQ